MNEPIRIVHVFGSLDRGGAETFVMNVYRHIDRTRIQFDFIVNETEKTYDYEPEIVSLGGRVYRVPRYTVSNYFSYKRVVGRLLKQHPEWKMIHGHLLSPGYIYFSLAQKHQMVTIAHAHISGYIKRSIKSSAKRLFQKVTISRADHLFACAESAAGFVFGRECHRSILVKNGIDLTQFVYREEKRKKIRKEFNLGEEKVYGHIGRFMPVKNHQYLLAVFHEILKVDKTAILLLVGDGRLKADIQAHVNQLGIASQVIFTGTRTDVAELLCAMDVLIFPSIREALPVSLIEAQATGLPCVISASITHEVVVVDEVKQLDITDMPHHWASVAIQMGTKNGNSNRMNKIAPEKIKGAGYNINEVVQLVSDFYITGEINGEQSN